MNTGSSASNYNFDNFNSNTTSTGSNIATGINTQTSTSTGINTGSHTSSPTVETMDLSFATAQVANESKSILDRIGNFFGDLIDGAKETGAKIVNGAKSLITDGLNGLSELGSNIVSAAATLASNTGSLLSNLVTWGLETAKKVRSTAAVVGTSIVSGVANIGEGLVDGITWCGGKVVEGGSWIVGKIAGLFSDEAEQSVMEWREEAKTDVKEFISTDWIGKANDWFYQETELGQAINENSYIKYDSKLAKGITTATEMVGKIIAATAATFIPGGAVAAPLILGFTSGVGEKSEQLYQENINTTGAQELGIFISGLGEAANWYAQSKLGEGALGLINNIKTAGLKQTGSMIWSGIKSAARNIKTNGVVNTIKGAYKSSSFASLKAADNLADSAGIIGDNISDWLTGEEEFNFTNTLKASGELVSAWILNMGMDGLSDYLSGASKQADDLIKTTTDLEVDNGSSLGARFDEFTTGKNGTYGVDQGACRRMTYTEVLNSDWLTDPDDFKVYLKEKLPNWSEADLDDAFKTFTEGPRINDKGKEIVTEYIQRNNADYQSALDTFKKSFNSTQTPDYTKMVQKYIDAGMSEADAIYLLKTIDTTGVCSYAAAANGIAASFADNPQLFKEVFGYDLYKVVDGQQVINSSELLSDLYVYANLDTNGGKLFTMVDGKLTYLNKDFSQQVYLSGSIYTRDDILDGFLKSKSPDLGYTDNIRIFSNQDKFILRGMDDSTNYTVDDVKKTFDEILQTNSNVQIGVYRSENNQFTFYNMDGTVNVTTNSWNEGAGHAVFVTGMTDEGVIVSSWGEKLLIKYEDFINNRYNIAWGEISGITPATASNLTPTQGTTKIITDGVGDGASSQVITDFDDKQSVDRAKQAAQDYVDNLEQYLSEGISIEDFFKKQGIEITTIDSRLKVSELFNDPTPQMFSATEQVLKDTFGLKPSVINKITNNPNTYDIKSILRKNHIPETQIDEIVKLVNYSGMPNYKVNVEEFYESLKPYLDNDQIKQFNELISNYKSGYVGKMLENATDTQKAMVNLYTTTNTGYILINSKLTGKPLSEKELRKLYSGYEYNYELVTSGKSYDEQIEQLITEVYKDTYGTTEGLNFNDFNPTELQSLISSNPLPETVVVSRIGYDFGGLKKKKELKVGKTMRTDGFLSTAGSIEDANKFVIEKQRGSDNIRIDIIIPKGSDAAFIEPLSGVSGYYQDEVLLGPNSVLTIVEPAIQEKIDGKQLMTVIKCILTGGK